MFIRVPYLYPNPMKNSEFFTAEIVPNRTGLPVEKPALTQLFRQVPKRVRYVDTAANIHKLKFDPFNLLKETG
ncbi:MAG: hypothetical protein LBT09_06260 [Planctomycetaceae bacterium]|nr:hypothetical protein [Planctomycetaceae bacterium]